MPPSPLNVSLVGPFWTAQVTVLGSGEPQDGYLLRSLFLDRASRSLGSDRVLPPETLLALCWVREVKIEPANGFLYRWRRPNSANPPAGELTAAQIKSFLGDGTLALVAVAIDPAQFAPPVGGMFPTMTCVSGDLRFDGLVPEDGADTKLFQAVGLTPKTLNARSDASDLVGTLAVNAGGLSVFGEVNLPWESGKRAAPFRLARSFADHQYLAQYRLTLEEERLTAGERADFTAAWRSLSRALAPGNAQLGMGSPSAPAWVTAEVANPNLLPRLFWKIAAWSANPGSLPLHAAAGELNLLLTDQAPHNRRVAPASLARAGSDTAVIVRAGTGVDVMLTAGMPSSGAALRYLAEPTQPGWSERFTLDQIEVAFDPMATPALVRRAQGLADPVWAPGADEPIAPAVVWGSFRLDDGWAQLPVPNLTEAAYVAALPEPPPLGPQPAPRLQGALALGNDRPAARAAHAAEQPWTLIVTDVVALSGKWSLRGPSDALALTRVELLLHEPELVIDGLLWLGTGRPSAEDALPDLDDWTAALRSIPLRTLDAADRFQPLVTATLTQLTLSARTDAGAAAAATGTSARLGGWTMTIHANRSLLDDMAETRLLPDDTFATAALVWRRHPTLPMIQALPLTQTNTPPTHPGASRQLAPFALPVETPAGGRPAPASWRFGVAGDDGAASWPRLLDTASPAAEWSAHADLPMASLSVPGLVLDPHATQPIALSADEGLGLPLQYRHDLPYTDQLMALAQAARDASPSAQALTRDRFADHWRALAARAALSSAADVSALHGDDGAIAVEGLVEPRAWRATLTPSLSVYPGELTLQNADGSGVPLALREETALAGISARFADDGAEHLRMVGANENGYELVAGTMAAHAEPDGAYRDQRGLRRRATQVGALMRTPVQLVGAPALELTSTLEALELHTSRTAGAVPSWRFWFRDLPLELGTFEREAVLSGANEDINDPDATASERGHLNGYEWRLGPDAPSLFGLRFYPLTLEALEATGDQVRRVVLIGRLQLPLHDADEADELGNAVRITFAAATPGAALILSAISPVATEIEWPLARTAGEISDAPRLRFGAIALIDDGQRLELGSGVLAFFHFGAEWRIPLAPLRFDQADGTIRQTYAAAVDPREAVAPRAVTLALDTARGVHEVSLLLAVQLGRGVARSPSPRAQPLVWQLVPGELPALPAPAQRAALRAEVRFAVLGGTSDQPSWQRALLFEDVELAAPDVDASSALLVTRNALELSWKSRTEPLPGTPPRELQLLPGMHVDASAAIPGFAVLSWRVLTAPDDVPTLWLESSFLEALVTCRWGTFLQEPRAAERVLEQVVGSSAGDLVFGYTARSSGASFSESLLANGLLEIKNLISWPRGMSLDDTTRELTLPAVRAGGTLHHARHTLRVLLNQHEVPADAFEVSSDELIFRLKPGQAWQFLAVVEHQLVDVDPVDFEPAHIVIANDRRWTVIQEIRLLAPADFKAFLHELVPPADTFAPWVENHNYAAGDVVSYESETTHENHVYRCERAHLSQWNWNPERSTFFWTQIEVDPRLRTLAPSGRLALLGQAVRGYVRTELMQQLAEGSGSALDQLAPGTLLVEASAACWIRQQPLQAGPAQTLQFLPGSTQLAILANEADFAPTDPDEPRWLLLAMPFLGRLQARGRDHLSAPPQPPPALQIDPILNLHRRRPGNQPLPPLVLALACWAGQSSIKLEVATFDTHVGRTWSRLDPVSLEEALFRLHHLPHETHASAIGSVLATQPENAARLSRPAALARAFDVERRFYPPAPAPDAPLPADPTGGALLWRPDNLIALQGLTEAPAAAPPFGWDVSAAVLVKSPLFLSTSQGILRHAAATQLPVSTAKGAVHLAVSPYLGLERGAVPPEDAPMRLLVAELLGLDRATRALRSVSTRMIALGTPGANDASDAHAAALAWGRETHQRLSSDSPVAVLRLRAIHQVGSPGAGDALLSTRYGFAVVSDPLLPPASARRVFRLRAGAAELHFRDGRFGGSELPQGVRPIELAPPQTTGVQGLYLTQRPGADEASPVEWPWGLSALRTTVRHGTYDESAVGDMIDVGSAAATLHWQSLPHAIQFRATTGNQDGAGLPLKFRARAIRTLLPVLPDPPLPRVRIEQLGGFQPVLPGAVRHVTMGIRAGAMLTLRPQLQRQTLSYDPDGQLHSAVMVSGSVPVQHRAPRPVPLPANLAARPDVALRPWASALEPTAGAVVAPSPVDEAFFAGSSVTGTSPARRLRAALQTPAHGALTSAWDGGLVFRLDSDTEGAPAPADPLAGWTLRAAIRHGNRSFPLGRPVAEAEGVRLHRFDLAPEDRVVLSSALAAGSKLAAVIEVERSDAADGFMQTLSFPLVAIGSGAASLPLAPVFVHFEDPEYNRRLASAPKRATRLTATRDGAEPAVHVVTLAADRAEYDPSCVVSLRYDWDDDVRPPHEATRLELRRIDANNIPHPLRLRGGATLQPEPGKLLQISLLDVEDPGRSVALLPGETLELALTLLRAAPDGTLQRVVDDLTVVLALTVISDPVIPAPEAGYALLRRQQGAAGVEVECARFAWSPAAARVELVAPDDLRTGVVRRRAVFHWRDTVRVHSSASHAVQKLTMSGSTHFPVLDDVTD
jgi:hypothetical protein